MENEEEYRKMLRQIHGTDECSLCNPREYAINYKLCDSCKRVFKILGDKQ